MASPINHHHHHTSGDKTHQPKPPNIITNSELQLEFAHHDPTAARINNGGFGSCPASIIAAAQQWQLRFLREPDTFFHNDLEAAILKSRNVIKTLVNADHADEISIVDNVSTAVTIVLHHISRGFIEGKFHNGDAVVMFGCAYGAVKKAVEVYITRAGGRVVEVPLDLPVSSEEEIVREFRMAIDRGKAGGNRVALALIDHVTCMPSVVIPVRALVRVCREEGVEEVFVDGAHGVGCVDVDVEEIGADFYAGSLTKWFFCPPCVGFLYSKRTTSLHHPVVSHKYGTGLPEESSWIGTRDYSPLLVVPSALEFVNRFEGGIEGIKKRNHDSVIEMAQMLVKAWGTHLGCPTHMCSSMVMVGLPPCLRVRSEPDALTLTTRLREGYGVVVRVYHQPNKDGEVGDVNVITGYARVSYQVYNKVDDYYRFRDAVKELVRSGFTCS